MVLVSGIGQAAKIPQYLNVHFFNGLHGRALPAATAINYLDENHDPSDFEAAFRQSQKTDKLPLGIFYQEEGRPTFEDNLRVYEKNEAPLFKRKLDSSKFSELIEKKFKILG